MRKEEAIKLINSKGAKHEPFFFIVDYLMDDCLVLTFEEAESQNILFSFNNIGNCEEVEFKPISITEKRAVDFNHYEEKFKLVQHEILYGNSYLVNLTFPTQIKINGSHSDLFHYSRAKYKILFKDKFVVFSPETFVRISDGKIHAYPMKGTIDSSHPKALETILSDEKEMAEHATIVDLLRNDLSLVAENVKVTQYRFAEEIKSEGKNLLQISSEICGELPADYCEKLGTIIFDMLPAGSVTGAPKAKTLEIISRAEDYKRGYYTGIAGYFDGNALDSCVLIRFIENIDGKYYYKSGGGITSQSRAIDEYNELINKIYVPLG